MKKFWTKKEDDYLKDNYGKISSVIIAKILGRKSRKYITKRANKLGLNFPAYERISQRRNNINQYYFDYPNMDNSYYAGFIAGDGYIHGNLLDITLADKDVEILYKLKSDIACDYKITTKRAENVNWSDKVSLRIYSKRITIKLFDVFNIGERKSFSLLPPKNLTNEQALSYIIGLIDADGWIYYTKENYICFGICGTKEILIWINDILFKNYKISTNIRSAGKIYKLTRTGSKAIDICKELMKVNTPHKLSRKWNKVEIN
jgi:hypothetical protein